MYVDYNLLIIITLTSQNLLKINLSVIEVRRNMSNISQKDLGKVILEDLSKQTVSRCEMRCGASLVASARNHFDVMNATVFHERNNGYSLCFTAYRQDATNGRQKTCALELDHAYVADVSADEEVHLTWDHFHRMKRLADLMPVGDESGEGCVGITLRGLTSLACPSWRSIKNKLSEVPKILI